MWFVNFDKTYSRVGRLTSKRINGIGAALLKDEKGNKIYFEKGLSNPNIDGVI